MLLPSSSLNANDNLTKSSVAMIAVEGLNGNLMFFLVEEAEVSFGECFWV